MFWLFWECNLLFPLQRFANGPTTPNTALSSPPQANERTTKMKAYRTNATADTVSMETRRLIVDTPASPPHQPADVSSDLQLELIEGLLLK